ncbi:MAG: polysulfide reductase NrfD [Cyclobacteriaceae bacterium]|nr:polysulfide reductase NrfD [Cyclobacteriaceae bacterium]
MKYGFVIDNRKCIGCHACTVACKSEHDVPVGVNRTWVKQVEKGIYPNTKRVFSVTRCNHCTDAPCVSICPTEALFKREDGIVDFNNDRCIGCKSCMQACPYDALYIDPETNTAAKCNYCAHRTDIGLEPACVNVCPEQAIVSGDMENPETKISQLISMQQVKTRKPEKGTNPNVYYINGDESSLNPSATERSSAYIWSSQSTGVGHYAKYAESLTKGKDLIDMIQELKGHTPSSKEATYGGNQDKPKQVEVVMKTANAKRVYDTPDKGVLWGWEVSAYVLTKAISAGAFLVYFLGSMLDMSSSTELTWTAGIISLVFLLLTGLFLVMDLDRPDRFLYVLLRPHWESWLVKGGYFITIFGGAITSWLGGVYFNIPLLSQIGFWGSFIFGIMVAVYTAFLFAQAKGRDFWQSPTMAIHMIIHSIMAGSGALIIASQFVLISDEWITLFSTILTFSVVANLLIMLIELTITHPTEDAARTVQMILKGRYARLFWIGVIICANILPLVLIWVASPILIVVASVIILIGIYITEKIWIEAPQRIPLT